MILAEHIIMEIKLLFLFEAANSMKRLFFQGNEKVVDRFLKDIYDKEISSNSEEMEKNAP